MQARSDDGGVTDGDEVIYDGTNPLDGADDQTGSGWDSGTTDTGDTGDGPSLGDMKDYYGGGCGCSTAEPTGEGRLSLFGVAVGMAALVGSRRRR